MSNIYFDPPIYLTESSELVVNTEKYRKCDIDIPKREFTELVNY